MTALMRRSVYRAFIRELNGFRRVAETIPPRSSTANSPLENNNTSEQPTTGTTPLTQREQTWNQGIYLADALRVHKFGTHEFIGPPTLYRLQTMFPGVAIPQAIDEKVEEQHSPCSLSFEDAKHIIRYNAKNPNMNPHEGLQHYRIFADCLSNNLCTSVTRAHNILVELTTNLIPTDSGVTLDQSPYQFMYRFRISNFSNEICQLLSRHLIFADESRTRLEVPYGSPGVIGQQPDIKPGQTFQYYSGVGLNDDGSMEGSFQVKLRSSSQVVDVPFGPVCFMASPTAEKMQKLLNADKDSYSLRKLM